MKHIDLLEGMWKISKFTLDTFNCGYSGKEEFAKSEPLESAFYYLRKFSKYDKLIVGYAGYSWTIVNNLFPLLGCQLSLLKATQGYFIIVLVGRRCIAIKQDIIDCKFK